MTQSIIHYFFNFFRFVPIALEFILIYFILLFIFLFLFFLGMGSKHHLFLIDFFLRALEFFGFYFNNIIFIYLFNYLYNF